MHLPDNLSQWQFHFIQTPFPPFSSSCLKSSPWAPESRSSLRSLCLNCKCRHGFVASPILTINQLCLPFMSRSASTSVYEMWKHGIYGRCEQKHILHFIRWKLGFSSIATFHNNIFIFITFSFKSEFKIIWGLWALRTEAYFTLYPLETQVFFHCKFSQ